jgi:hypothetical protein
LGDALESGQMQTSADLSAVFYGKVLKAKEKG